MFNFNLNKLSFSFIFMFFVVCVGHLVSVYATINIVPMSNFYLLIDKFFFFGYEKGFTALFSAFLFIVVGRMFFEISKILVENKLYWKLLSYVAYFLACDEWFAIHDAALNIYGLGFFNIPIWLWVYGTLAICLFVFSIPVLLKSPRYLFFAILVSGFVYVSGSGVMEVITYEFNDTASIMNQVGWFIEDGLEMCGLLLMIFFLSKWIIKNGHDYISVKKWALILITLIGFLDCFITLFII